VARSGVIVAANCAASRIERRRTNFENRQAPNFEAHWPLWQRREASGSGRGMYNRQHA
jgi:hypothetical protein